MKRFIEISQLHLAVLFGFFLFSQNCYAEKITILVPENPPFQYKDQNSGKLDGPFIIIMDKVFSDANLKYELRWVDSWNRAKIWQKEGKFNGVSNMGYNKERAEYLHYSPPIIKTSYGMIVRIEDFSSYNSIHDFANFKIAVHGPSRMHDSLKKLQEKEPSIIIDLGVKPVFGLTKLIKKRVNAVYGNRENSFAIAKSEGIHDKMRYVWTDKDIFYYISFSKKVTDKSIVDRFNTTYKCLYKNGIIQDIVGKDFVIADIEEQK